MLLFGTLAVVCADNLAAHSLAGYKSLHSAFRRCRFCMATAEDMRTKVGSDSFIENCSVSMAWSQMLQ